MKNSYSLSNNLRKIVLFCRDTPTSAGPNSFNKSTKGFTDQTAVFKKQFGV